MKTRVEVSAQKLRGGFYTPPPLVEFCLARLEPLLPQVERIDLLEPSAGDGAFVRGIAARPALARRTRRVTAVEPLDLEAEKCRRALAQTGIDGSVLVDSAVGWGRETEESFDAAVGNPPFVRYQFIPAAEKESIRRLGERLELPFAGVSNLWLPVLAASLARLRAGGAFSFVVPTELFTGLSANRLRRWLAETCCELRIDLFEPGSFPGVLQEVLVLSGRRVAERPRRPTLTIGDHRSAEQRPSWVHELDAEEGNWTRYLLKPEQLRALEQVRSLASVRELGSLARFQVSIVTGANDFFSVTDAEVERHGLEPWARPLLPRIRHAPGLLYGRADQEETRRSGARGWLLEFAADTPDPLAAPGAAAYLQSGRQRELHERYKCRIRQPWFRVPHFERGGLLLSKRSHRHPRVIVNEAGAYTTDTIYRGEPLPGSPLSARALSAGFHSSLTLLSAELEGRSFGGGVLELVPSEIERLAVAVAPASESWLPELDAIARSGDEDGLVRRTDELLIAAGIVPRESLEILGAARRELMDRRLARNQPRLPRSEEALEAAAA